MDASFHDMECDMQGGGKCTCHRDLYSIWSVMDRELRRDMLPVRKAAEREAKREFWHGMTIGLPIGFSFGAVFAACAIWF